MLRRLSEAEGGPADLGRGLGAVGGLQGREEEACTASWRAALGCRARRQCAGPTASQPSRDSALEQRLITTCQSCVLSSLTCLHIFPNKERSCKHGNHLLWQRLRAVRAQQGPEPRPAQDGAPRGGEEGRPGEGRRVAAVAALHAYLELTGKASQCRDCGGGGGGCPRAPLSQTRIEFRAQHPGAQLLRQQLGKEREGWSRARHWHIC